MIHRRSRRATVLQYAALFGFIVFLSFPLLWMLSTSFKGPRELVALIPSLIPVRPTLENYGTAFGEQDLVQSAANSIQLSLGNAILTVLVALPAAYGLARYATILRKATMGWILVSQIFPLILIIIPLFLVLKTLHLLDSLSGLLIVYLVWSLPFTLWMLQTYVKAIPLELEEAASIDGAGRLRILREIVLPLLAPGIVVAARPKRLDDGVPRLERHITFRGDPTEQYADSLHGSNLSFARPATTLPHAACHAAKPRDARAHVSRQHPTASGSGEADYIGPD